MSEQVPDEVMARAQVIFGLDLLATVFFHVSEHEEREAWETRNAQDRQNWARDVLHEWSVRREAYLRARGEPRRGYRDDEQVRWSSLSSRWSTYSLAQQQQWAAVLFDWWRKRWPAMSQRQRDSLVRVARRALQHEAAQREAKAAAAQAASVKAYRQERQLETLIELNSYATTVKTMGALGFDPNVVPKPFP
jgi:hypothetical protein